MAILIPDQPEFYYSEALQPCHAACKILKPWVQWLVQNKSFVNTRVDVNFARVDVNFQMFTGT